MSTVFEEMFEAYGWKRRFRHGLAIVSVLPQTRGRPRLARFPTPDQCCSRTSPRCLIASVEENRTVASLVPKLVVGVVSLLVALFFGARKVVQALRNPVHGAVDGAGSPAGRCVRVPP